MRYKNFKISSLLMICLGLSGVQAQTVKDRDGNVYKTVTIGTQVWMAENLKTTRYNNGAAIPLLTDNMAWSNLSTPGYCWYKNDQATYGNTYGALYNWYTVNTGNLCPRGWHVPTDAEWTTLTDYLGGASAAGIKIVEPGTTQWQRPETGATNETGFKARPGGARDGNGGFLSIGEKGYWWSATEKDTHSAWCRQLHYYYNNTTVFRSYFGKRDGFFVRCVRD